MSDIQDFFIVKRDGEYLTPRGRTKNIVQAKLYDLRGINAYAISCKDNRSTVVPVKVYPVSIKDSQMMAGKYFSYEIEVSLDTFRNNDKPQKKHTDIKLQEVSENVTVWGVVRERDKLMCGRYPYSAYRAQRPRFFAREYDAKQFALKWGCVHPNETFTTIELQLQPKYK